MVYCTQLILSSQSQTSSLPFAEKSCPLSQAITSQVLSLFKERHQIDSESPILHLFQRQFAWNNQQVITARPSWKKSIS